MNIFLEGLQVFVSLAFLLYASWSDLKTREVSNKVWVFFAVLGLPLSLMYLYLNFSTDMLYLYLITYGVMSALALLFCFVGLYGGADAWALICLSLTLPLYPYTLIQWTYVPYIFPLSVFSNAVILAALSAIYVLLRNFLWRLKVKKQIFEGLERESKSRKFLALFTGYKIPIGKLKKSALSLLPIEDVQVSESGKTERNLVLLPDIEDTENSVERILDAVKRGEKIDWVWVTPGLPMLVFITAGLITALILGDFVWIILSRLL